jgi:hypothetical protein
VVTSRVFTVSVASTFLFVEQIYSTKTLALLLRSNPPKSAQISSRALQFAHRIGHPFLHASPRGYVREDASEILGENAEESCCRVGRKQEVVTE